MTVNEFLSDMDALSADLAGIVLDNMDEAALDAKALIQRRIQEKGQDTTGALMQGYSDQALPLFFFAKNSKQNVLAKLGIDANGKKLDKKARRKRDASGKLQAAVNPYAKGISYKDWRALMGLPTDHVTYTVTEEMWKKIGVLEIGIQGDVIRAKVGGRDDATIKKMGYLADRRGDFMGLTPEEIVFVESKLRNKVLTNIKDRFQK